MTTIHISSLCPWVKVWHKMSSILVYIQYLFYSTATNESESEVMCGQVWWPILRICALHLTHPSAHTHCEYTPGAVGSHIAAAPREQLGVQCLAQGHLSRGIEGGESAGYSLPPPTFPAGPETRTLDLRVTSPTLSIRPQLPRHKTLPRLPLVMWP